jgi:hypothetical protein
MVAYGERRLRRRLYGGMDRISITMLVTRCRRRVVLWRCSRARRCRDGGGGVGGRAGVGRAHLAAGVSPRFGKAPSSGWHAQGLPQGVVGRQDHLALEPRPARTWACHPDRGRPTAATRTCLGASRATRLRLLLQALAHSGSARSDWTPAPALPYTYGVRKIARLVADLFNYLFIESRRTGRWRAHTTAAPSSMPTYGPGTRPGGFEAGLPRRALR